jgi:replication-associated recombination protein RarA
MNGLGVFAWHIQAGKFTKKGLEGLEGFRGHRVTIVDEAQELSKSMQTALHPVVECDTPGVQNLIILCTTELNALTPALRSRCAPIPLEPLSGDDLEQLVERGCEACGLAGVPPDLLAAIRKYFTVRTGFVSASPRLILNIIDLVAVGVPPYKAVESIVGAVRA